MNISDLGEAGNPDEDEGVLWLGQEQNKPEKAVLKGETAFKLSRNTLIVLVIILSSAASFGLGFILAQTEQGSAKGAGLVVGSTSGANTGNSMLSTSALDTSAPAPVSSAISGSKNAPALGPAQY